MSPTPPPPIEYDKNRAYTITEFDALNSWLETHNLIVDGEAISTFELDPAGKLIPVRPPPAFKGPVITEIIRQLGTWNALSGRKGVVTGSRGGFNLGTSVRMPAAAFTPRAVYRNLTQLQLLTFRGEPFHPSVIFEVEDVSAAPAKLDEVSAKIEHEYFAGGTQLAILVDPISRTIFTFKRDKKDGVVRRLDCGWSDVSCGDILPRFVLRVSKIDDATSPVCCCYSCYLPIPSIYNIFPKPLLLT